MPIVSFIDRHRAMVFTTELAQTFQGMVRMMEPISKCKYHGSVCRIALSVIRLDISVIVLILKLRFILGCDSVYDGISLLSQCTI